MVLILSRSKCSFDLVCFEKIQLHLLGDPQHSVSFFHSTTLPGILQHILFETPVLAQRHLGHHLIQAVRQPGVVKG